MYVQTRRKQNATSPERQNVKMLNKKNFWSATDTEDARDKEELDEEPEDVISQDNTAPNTNTEDEKDEDKLDDEPEIIIDINRSEVRLTSANWNQLSLRKVVSIGTDINVYHDCDIDLLVIIKLKFKPNLSCHIVVCLGGLFWANMSKRPSGLALLCVQCRCRLSTPTLNCIIYLSGKIG